MSRGTLLIIEGTDCSGKNTQSEILLKRLKKEGRNVIKISFPMYNTPTGKIVGGPYLGKSSICSGWFQEGANAVDPKVASLYYAADRYYNIDTINKHLNEGYIVILDRYVTSNMAHQGGKIADKLEREKMYQWLEKLEYELLELPKPDIKILLHLPYKYAKELQKNRIELDEHEKSYNNLTNAENAYLEIAALYNFDIIECVKDGVIRTIDDISDEVYAKVTLKLENMDI